MGYLPISTRVIYVRTIGFSKLLTKNREALHLPERLSKERGMGKELGPSRFDFHVHYAVSSQDVLLMVEEAHYLVKKQSKRCLFHASISYNSTKTMLSDFRDQVNYCKNRIPNFYYLWWRSYMGLKVFLDQFKCFIYAVCAHFPLVHSSRKSNGQKGCFWIGTPDKLCREHAGA